MDVRFSINNLSVGYGKKAVLEGVSFEAHSGQLIGVIGRNGTGKSTLLRTMAALQKAISGTITINDRSINSFSPKELSRIISIVTTNIPTDVPLTVRELVGMGRSPYTDFFGRMKAEDHRIVEQSLLTVGITALAERSFSQLSDGEKQKALIAKALAQQTPIIILDEPTAFLDYPSKQECIDLLRRLAHENQKLIFITTHDLPLINAAADKFLHVGE